MKTKIIGNREWVLIGYLETEIGDHVCQAWVPLANLPALSDRMTFWQA